MSKLFLLLAAAFVSIQAHADPKELLFQRAVQMAEKQKALAFDAGATAPAVQAGTYTQKLDHDATPDTRTFAQRYWVSSTYATSPSAPVLLYICGEGECGDYALYGQAAAHARTIGAYMVALEHRYYGQSQPFEDLSTDHLRYLTTGQALADIVSFQAFLKEQMNLTGPWISMGGSYPGALSAYLRGQYPDLFLGALASSGPVKPDLDFSEYDHHVAKMAGPECLAAIQKVVVEVEQKIKTDAGFTALKTQFDAEVLNRRDDFIYMIADTGAAAIQYGMRDAFCNYVQNEGLEGYAQAKSMADQLFGNLANMSAQMAEDPSFGVNTGAIGMRQWFYQSCTEYGFWQNAWPDPKESARSPIINADYHNELCRRLFGMNKSLPVDTTMKKFYEPLLEKTTSHIFFTNGAMDPWMNLSVAPENGNMVNPNTQAMVIPGAAHCDDLRSGGSQQVQAAKQKFQSLMADWLSQ